MDINYEEKELGMSPPFKFIEEGFLNKLLVRIPTFHLINVLGNDKQRRILSIQLNMLR